MTRFNEVTEKLNKMFKGTEEQKDDLVLKLKTWVSKNRNTEYKEKIDAINCFLADKGIV